MNLNDRPDLRALKQLLAEVGQLNLYYKIVKSEDKQALKSNIQYAVKSLGQKMDSSDFQQLLTDARRNALEIGQSDVRERVLSLIDGLQNAENHNDVLDKMTEAFLNRQKKYHPVMRKPGRKSQVKKHPKFDFSSMTAKALSR